jgi:hypothetical protein
MPVRLERIWWTDATNVAGGWHTHDELQDFATNQKWKCTNTGWLVHEDDECVVLAGRMTNDREQFGLVERIPKRMIEHREILYTEKETDD